MAVFLYDHYEKKNVGMPKSRRRSPQREHHAPRS
jgi:hypothetical protein